MSKKIEFHSGLRVAIYVFVVLASVLLIATIISGAKKARDIALNNLKISADTSEKKSCANGEVLYGINNYPYSSTPTESGAHKKYTDKMPSGIWKCSNVCGSADTTKFSTELLPKLTVTGGKLNIVANKSEFDALVEKSSGKNEILDRTVILESSLQRKNLGCFGPSEDYAGLSGATLTKQNTTWEDQKKAEEERKKAAEEAAKSAASSSAYSGTVASGTDSDDASFSAPASDSDSSDTSSVDSTADSSTDADTSGGGPTSGSDVTNGSNSKDVTFAGLTSCWEDVTSMLRSAGFTGKLASEIKVFLAKNGMAEVGDTYFQAVVNEYEPLRKAKEKTGTWTKAQHKSANKNYDTCTSVFVSVTDLSWRLKKANSSASPKTTEGGSKQASYKDIKIKINLFLDQSTSKRVNINSASPVYLVAYAMYYGRDTVKVSAVDRVVYNKQYGTYSQAYLRIPASTVKELDDDALLLVHMFTNGGMGSKYRESTIVVSLRENSGISSNKGVRLLGQNPASLSKTLNTNLTLRYTQYARDQKVKIDKWGYDQTLAFESYIWKGLRKNWRDVERALKNSKVYSLSERTSDEDYNKVLSELNK